MSSVKMATTIIGAALSSLIPTAAFALVTSPAYDVTKCLAACKVANSTCAVGNDQLLRSSGSLKNPSSTNNAVVFCPVTKTTSGPGIQDDLLWDATIPVTVAHPGDLVECELEVWQTPVLSDNSNFVDSYSQGTTATGNLTVPLGSAIGVPTDFWDGNVGSPAPSWYYADLRCVLAPGASIGNYTVRESGSIQPRSIFSSAGCASDSADTLHWRYLGESQGGGVYSDASSGGLFRFDCPVPANSVVTFAVQPSYASQTLGCSFDATATPQTWPSTSVGSNLGVVQTLPRPGSTLIVTPGGSHKLVCDIQPATGLGDGTLYSYRADTGTIATGTPTGGGSAAINAFDHQISTRWTTGTAQVGGETFVVDLQSPRTFNKIIMDSGSDTNDYAHGYSVYVSNNGSTWGSAIATGTPGGPVVTVTFTSQTTRYIKIVQTKSNSHWWSIHELSIFAN